MKRIAAALILLSLGFGAAWAEPVAPDDPALTAAIDAADILVLGEVHDNPRHHRIQALAMERAFRADGARPAVILEMLPRRMQDDVDAYSGMSDGFGPAMDWSGRGWPDPAIYAPVFRAAFDAGAAIRAGDLDRDGIRALYAEGPDALPPAIRAVYDLMSPLDETVAAEMTDIQFDGHCGLMPRERMAGMVTIQRARDAALAEAVLEAFREGFRPVVLITGNGHARTDHGAGRLLSLALPDASILSLGILEQAASNPPYTFHIVTEAQPRPDPCEGLEKRLKGE